MALTVKSIDEILTLMADTWDGLTAPSRIFRNNNNKLWLVFRSIAAGYTIIQDSIMALHNRFDPTSCADEDLLSTAKMVGTDFKVGSGSLLRITVTNNAVGSKTLPAGQYKYTSTNGDVFLFTLAVDLVLTTLAASVIAAMSANKGSFLVSSVASITPVRVDGAAIDSLLSFSCADNSSSLGYSDESNFDFRTRILGDTNRQDAVAELELAIRNLPGILECNVVFNPNNAGVSYDGITVGPFQILIILTGAPDGTLADLVVASTINATKMVDAGKVVHYHDSHYLGGLYPVYYTNHLTADFILEISYRFDSSRISQITAEANLTKALNVYRNMSQHMDIITEEDVYTLLSPAGGTSVRVVNVDIDGGSGPIPFLDVPKTRMANLTTVTFTGIDIRA
jgi:hypothetical protein